MFPVVSCGHTDPEIAIINDRWRSPQVLNIPKYSAEDTSLVIGNGAGETTVFPIPAGSRVTIDVPGLHYNRESYLVQ